MWRVGMLMLASHEIPSQETNHWFLEIHNYQVLEWIVMSLSISSAPCPSSCAISTAIYCVSVYWVLGGWHHTCKGACVSCHSWLLPIRLSFLDSQQFLRYAIMHIALCPAFESIKLWIILNESVPSTIIPRVYRFPFNISLSPTHKQKPEKSSDRQIPIPSFCFLASAVELRESQPLAGAETCRTSLCLKVAPRWCRRLLSPARQTLMSLKVPGVCH